MRQLGDEMIIKKDGYGYSLSDANGRYIGKASIAVKYLAHHGLICATGKRQPIYFTTRGYWVWAGGAPTGEAAEMVAKADAYAEYIHSMMV